MTNVIDVEATNAPADPEGKPADATMAVATRSQMGVGKALTVEELHQRLEFIRQVMKKEMKEGQDYGKIPGTGDKPSLLQPGAQKLLMTFNFREQVKKEVLRELPHATIFGHREYEFIVTVFPAGLRPEDGWDGVGTCSTMESKYRYRKATRKCPKCGAEAIIEEKPEFVKGRLPGWVCWKKRAGCGEIFHKEHPDITKQSLADVENEDPADAWNTVRKMAFKRALVAAAINATNTSELWTQDLEDMSQNEGRQKEKSSENSPRSDSKPSGGMSTAPQNKTLQKIPKPATEQAAWKGSSSSKDKRPTQAIFADATTRERMIAMFIEAVPLLHEFFVKAGCILETEKIENLPLRFVPVTRRQAKALQAAIIDFGNGAEALLPYPPNPEAEPEKATRQPSPTPTPPTAKPVESGLKRDAEWFWDVVISVPRKGMKRVDYQQKPDTIGSLYDEMKQGNKESQSRLWGLVNHWDCQPRTVNGRTYPPTEEDKVCREALDAFAIAEEHKGHGDENEEVPF